MIRFQYKHDKPHSAPEVRLGAGIRYSMDASIPPGQTAGTGGKPAVPRISALGLVAARSDTVVLLTRLGYQQFRMFLAGKLCCEWPETHILRMAKLTL